MKGTIRIIAGSMRGRAIPFDNKKFSDADVTPQKVKGALFSMLGEGLYGKFFVDLFSGSGQMGMEALSRNCSSVVFCEKDKERFTFIKKTVHAAGLAEKSVLLNMDYESALKSISASGIKAHIVFIDPPYAKSGEEVHQYSRILENISNSGILADDAIAAVQHFSGNILPEKISRFSRSSLKKYGTTSISFYRFN